MKRKRPECLYTKERKAKGPGRKRTSKNVVQQLEAKIKVLESMVATSTPGAENDMYFAAGETLPLGETSFGGFGNGHQLMPVERALSVASAGESIYTGHASMPLRPSLPMLPGMEHSGFVAPVDSPENEAGFWLAPLNAQRPFLGFDPNLAMRMLARPGVDRPLSMFEMDLPDTSVMNSLFRVYRETLGNLILYSPEALRYADASPVVRLAMSALGALYLPECTGFANLLYQRARSILAPTLAGDIPPTLDIVQALLNVVIYAGVQNDEHELLWAHRHLRLLTNFTKELGLDNERHPVITRNWTGQPIHERDVNLRRAVFWTVFCAEQQFVLMDTVRGNFRQEDVNVGLPMWTDDPRWKHVTSPPIRLSQFDAGLAELAYSPYARTIFLHHIIRKMVDVGIDAYEHQIRTGDFALPMDLLLRRQWVRDRLKEFYIAEVQYSDQDAHQFGDVLIPAQPDVDREGAVMDDGAGVPPFPASGTTMFAVPIVDKNGTVIQAAAGQRVFLKRLQAKHALSSKAIVYHGLCAFVGAPREDLEAFFDVTNVGLSPVSKFERHRAKERLAKWINLPATFASRQAAKGGTLLPDESVNNVITVYEHVAGVVTALQELLSANPSVSFVHPLTLWCIWIAGILDLARFVLSEQLPEPEKDARIPFIVQVLKHVTASHCWPFATNYIEGFERMYEWALRNKASQVVATLTLQPNPAQDHMLDCGLRFFPRSDEESGSSVGRESSPEQLRPASSGFSPMLSGHDMQLPSAVSMLHDFDDLEAILNS